MSCVYNYILKLQAADGWADQLVNRLNASLHQEFGDLAGLAAFARVDRHAGGPRYMEMFVYLAALNSVDMPDVVSRLRKAIEATRNSNVFLEDPRSLILFCKEEGDSQMSAWWPSDVCGPAIVPFPQQKST